MSSSFSIGDRLVGDDAPVYIVAELSANHLGEYWRAEALVKAAAAAGADAVKLQTYTPETMTIDCDDECFRVAGSNPWKGRNLYNLYDEAQTPWDWYEKLKAVADDKGIHIFSTAFDASAIAFLESQNTLVYKIASFEITDVPLLQAVAKTGKPVIISTGMAEESEMEEAVRVLREAGCNEIAMLHCVSAYPALPEQMHLRAIPELARRFDVVPGLSDHSLRPEIAAASVALGARILEKHLTLHRSDGGPDAAFSLEPTEFANTVRTVRNVDKALGNSDLGFVTAENNLRRLRRSLFVVEDIKAGEPFSRDNLRVIRPGAGLHPRHLPEVVGKRAARDVKRGTPLDWSLVETS